MKSLDGPNQFSSPDEALTHTFFKTSSLQKVFFFFKNEVFSLGSIDRPTDL
jgi:hypothetical protein